MNFALIPLYHSSEKILKKSNDCYLLDADEKKYIDFEAGVWCCNIGHNNKQLLKKINSQIKDSIHHGYHFRNEFAEALSLKLQQLIGFENGASVFLSSGSEAVNLSITIAKHITGKKKILKIDNSYLSAYGYGQISDDNDSLMSVKFNDFDAIRAIDFKTISAFLIETGGASVDMVKIPDKEFISTLVDRCRKNNCLLIAEEVTTGMGRMGKWFGYQHYNITPDMVVTGKALGNGYPVSSVTVNAFVLSEFQKKPFRYAQSHQNDPLGCAIALETINILESGQLVEKAVATGNYFRNKLEHIKANHPQKIKDVRARGLMLAIEFTASVNGELISKQLFENGYVVGYKMNTLRFLPPLTIKKSHINSLTIQLNNLLADKCQ